ncbi:MAG: hypothetical protein ACI4OX_02700 [Akkermansia sp.]
MDIQITLIASGQGGWHVFLDDDHCFQFIVVGQISDTEFPFSENPKYGIVGQRTSLGKCVATEKWHISTGENHRRLAWNGRSGILWIPRLYGTEILRLYVAELRFVT